MFEFLKIQYHLGKISKEKLYLLIGRRITENEYEKIINEEG